MKINKSHIQQHPQADLNFQNAHHHNISCRQICYKACTILPMSSFGKTGTLLFPNIHTRYDQTSSHSLQRMAYTRSNNTRQAHKPSNTIGCSLTNYIHDNSSVCYFYFGSRKDCEHSYIFPLVLLFGLPFGRSKHEFLGSIIDNRSSHTHHLDNLYFIVFYIVNKSNQYYC